MGGDYGFHLLFWVLFIVQWRMGLCFFCLETIWEQIMDFIYYSVYYLLRSGEWDYLG